MQTSPRTENPFLSISIRSKERKTSRQMLTRGLHPLVSQLLSNNTIRQDDPFAQVTRDLNDQGFETAFGDIRWLSQRKVSSAEKKYSSIVLKIANESKHRQLLESSDFFLDGQWHNIAVFNYHRPPKECADATMAGSKAITA